MELERTFDHMSDVLQDLTFGAVRQWKSEHPGKKAIAFFPVYAPVEIIHAAGMLPVGLAGAGDKLDIQHADSRFGSFICSIIKTTLEMGMTGHLEPFDGFLFSSICDSARNLCFVFKRNFPQMYVDFVHLPHNSASQSSVDFLESEYRRLIAELERLGGEPITEAALRRSIGLYNRQRALVRRLYEVRSASPHLLRAWESYLVTRAGNFIPVEQHIEILEGVLDQLDRRPAKRRDSIRVVVEGSFCEQPPLEVIRMLEAAGCDIVEDDFAINQRWFQHDVSSNDPVRALAESYVQDAVYSSVRHDYGHPRWEGLADKIRGNRADAVIMLIAKFCEPAYFDYVLFKKKLDEMGLPHLLLEFEEKLFTFDRLRTEVETFVESLVFD